jgi:DNA-directed RNA polymerase subunit RPC12/RpoP
VNLVATVGDLALFYGIIVLGGKLAQRCPECGSLETKQFRKKEIPGTEYHRRPDYGSGPTTVYAKYWVYYRCQSCGHRWGRKEELHKRSY